MANSIIPTTAEILDWQKLIAHLPRRRKDANKGEFGHVLVLGGNYGMAGAARMAGEAAARVGAGLVSVATRPEHAVVMAMACPELMCHGIKSAADLVPLFVKATVLVVGPGLGQDSWAQELWQQALSQSHPKVVDADALNLLAQHPRSQNNWILTPHPGEAGRLLNCTSAVIQEDRAAAVIELQHRYGGVVVLKGAGTLVQAANAVTGICSAGNPGMASGGMGDVLSGVLGGLLAQGLSLQIAAELGVVLHAQAADRVAQKGGERGMLALDLMGELRSLVNASSDP